MAQITPCCLPKFGSVTEASQRPMSLRINPNAGDDAHLLSVWRDNKLCAVIQVTWGLILRCYMGSDDVCFGYQHVDANEQITPTEGSPNTMQPSTVQLVINEGDSVKTVLARGNGATVVDEGRNAIVDSYRLYNTVVLIRSYRPNSQRTVESSAVSPSTFTLPQECLLRLHVKVIRENVRIFLEWRNDGMSMEHVKGIATLFQNLLTKVLSPEDVSMGNLKYFTDPDSQRISNWNGPSPQVHDRCIHDIIREQVISRPHDEAICAWDGSLSYREFDQQATKLAYHLQEQGVGPEVLVPLCFDKSMWYFVALLAVLKAGGAFVPLDPKHPPARLQSLIQKVNARLVLCSEWHADRLIGLTEVVIPLSQTTFDRIPSAPAGFISSDEVNCSNAAYVIFTSGSTGEPKGTLLEHRAYCSSAMVHGPRLLIFPDSRVLQFAAHTFDASLAESISPLMHGACVCIPNEDDRLNDIVGAIKRLRANYASLTPSFIEFIEPSMIPEVQTLILAGEAMSETHRAKWSTINLVNGFGPTEASVTAAINSKVTATTDCRDIGLPLNARCWIANPDDHNQLAPVGAIGEMLLEGPTLARGYINNPSKTAETFIYDPEFVRHYPTSTQGRRRFYKTGDLVRYNSDIGSLTYIGRKDNQVKLHGQRVELGEVEACLTSEALVKHCVVFLPKEGYAQGKLTAVLSLTNGDGRQSKAGPLDLIPREIHKQSVSTLRERLSGRLPTYMVPAIWVSVSDMPFLPSKKLDRKGVLTWLSGMNRNPYLAETTTGTAETAVAPATDVERKLVQVWSRLLNIPAEQVPFHESFLKLGGDSISAMTCMNLCKKHGIAVTMQDVLRSSSIRELASRAEATSDTRSASHEEKVEVPFPLSPIQALHFKARREGQGHFNQSILTRLNRPIEGGSLRKAIDLLVRKHSMLRARFEISRSNNEIKQRITKDVAGSYRWTHHHVDSESDIDLIVAASQESISCFSGPLLAVDLVDVRDSKQVLSMVAHHLVVDIVSWRVIMQDLEDTLSNPSQDLASYMPFQTWLELQRQHTKQIEEQEPELETLPAPDFNYWGLAPADIIYGDVRCSSFCLDEKTTSRLMSDCHTPLRTEPVDLLLAAMLFSFGETFADRSLPVIYNEGHGREPWDTAIDISRTVGWFTTLYPILIENPKDAVEALIRVKDRRRKVSDNGRSSFSRRALQQSSSHRAHDCPMEINLNYLGQHRDLQRPDGLFQLAQQMVGETREGGGSADFGRDTPRFSLFEISAAVIGGRLRFVFSFSASMKRKEDVQHWVRSCQDVLESLAIQLPSLPLQRTLSDFPLMTMAYPELSLLQTQKLRRHGIHSMDEVEDIYPCSKMQQGVLLSQARDPMLYAVSGCWEVQAGPSASKPDVQRLVGAWNKVVDHHAMLRTVFATGLSRRHPFSHIVLKKYTSTPVLLRCTDDEEIISVLKEQSPADYRSAKPAHRLTICQSASGTTVCKLELSHAAMDGNSISLLLRDLRRAYGDGIDQGRRPLFKDFLHYLQRQPNKQGISHWCDYLSGLQPCHLPSDLDKTTGRKSLQSIRLDFTDFNKLQSFCSANGITVANAFNAAWCLTLAEFCQTKEVCFSYLTSLRDASVPEIESMVGPIINLLPCRLRIASSDVVDIARRIQDDYMENYPYRDVSLIDIQHAMKSSRISLFNTGVSYRKLPSESGDASSIKFKPVGRIHDPAEVAVYINVEATDTDAQLDLNYWSHWLSDVRAEEVAAAFLRSLSEMAGKATSKSSERPVSFSDDHVQVGQQSRPAVPEPTHCVHALIESQTAKMPDNLAIAAGERDLTYGLLNEFSSALANYLINLGVRPGIEVPISFDNSDSPWAIIAILAIWKAGAICVPIEMDGLSEEAHAWMLEADLQLAISSLNRAESLEEITPYVIPLTYEFLKALETGDYVSHKTALTDLAYIAFPREASKRIVLNHREMAASCSSAADEYVPNQNSAMPEVESVSSYGFFVKAFGILSRGGCLSESRHTRDLVLKEQLLPATTLLSMATDVDEGGNTSPNISSIGTPALTPRYSQSSLSSVSEFENRDSDANKNSTETKLRSIWAEVLEIEPAEINSDDSFFELGGDSLTAMSLGSAARADGLTITVADIFAHPVLEDMIKCCQTVDTPVKPSQIIEPFSLLPGTINREELLAEVASTCGVLKSAICDVYPCSALQEGLITASFRQPGAYVANPVLKLARNIDVETFKAAWQKTVDEIDILRTRIIHTAAANFVQAVLKPSPIDWDRSASDVATRPGGPLAGYRIMDTGYSRTFTWSIHHSIYDGWSLPLVFGKVEENYSICQNASRPSVGKQLAPYSAFIDHLQKRDVTASENFWRTYLGNISAPQFPDMKSAGVSKIISSNRLQISTHITPQRKDVTLPALVRAAWAIVLSLHTESEDVCFGETIMGRNIEVSGAAEIAGPLLTTVPTRIAVDSSMKVTEYLERVHQSTATIIPHQHIGLQRIRKLSKDTRKACGFQNLLVIQTAMKEMDSGIWSVESTETNQEFFTYPLTVECKVSETVNLTAYFDDRVIPAWRLKRFLGQFSVVLNQLAATPQFDTKLLSDLDVVSEDDRTDMEALNRGDPTFVDRTIHELINDQRLKYPDSPSVASWDGSLSYQELLDTASGFANHLSALGVGPETLVPMCMDKSVWMIVTIMSILIAGGAFVPLDPAHPVSRHEEILEETGANIMLCTPKYQSRYLGKVATVLGVDQRTVKSYQATRASASTSATSSNVAYSIFTSGSTGRPKGIIIEHRAFTSSTMAYGPIIHLKPGIRVFQFASLTFDAAVMEILGTLIFGGCVCIPSDEERLNDISGAIRRLNASWLFCTPSLASIMEPSSVPSLKVIVCGGEMMSHEAMTKWSDKVHFINAYGPTETSVYATFNPNIGKDRNPANIGKTIPSTHAWIVDPNNHDRLYPVGTVGELALEGPVLAREYLKNPEKTASAFITNPKWARDKAHGTSNRRIYLTGDLARLTVDGSLEYVGRKDNQVKLHGQRMELGEIEYRLHEHPHVRHVVIVLPKTGRLQKRLVAILSLNSLSTETSLISSAGCSLVEEHLMERQGMAELMEVQANLASQLPPYMVPQTWAVINTLPMLVSGKIDRKKITGWVEAVDDTTYNRVMRGYDKLKRSKAAVSNTAVPRKKDDTLSVLHEILAHVLNIPADRIDLGMSFTSIGGDSITGMALVSHARKRGISLSLLGILQATSVKELAKAAETGVKSVNQTEDSDNWFDLSAIQKFYFEYAAEFKGSARFNQSITLQLPRRIEPSVIANGLNAITKRHAMLRARFRQINGKWEQRIITPGEGCYDFQVTALREEHDLQRMIAITQNGIDLQNGPVFAANLFEAPGVDQILFLVANHLCVDMVSWRLILQDLEEFVHSGSLTPDWPFPFPNWCVKQLEHCKKDNYQNHLPFSPAPAMPEYWGMRNVPNCYGDVKMKKFLLNTKKTALALDKCHTRLRTEPLDLFLAVLMHSFRRTFTDREVPTVYNETHGRHPWDGDIDLSGTVGWFTSICPLPANLSSDDILDTLRMIKDARHKTINFGSSFFAQNVLAPRNGNHSLPMTLPFEIVFNYLGKLQQLERNDSLFQHYGRAYDENDFMVAGDMGPRTPRFSLFEVSAIVIRDQLQFSFTYNKNMQHQSRISSWISECESTLHQALDALQHDSQLEVMPSDYPLLSTSQRSLRVLFEETLPKLGVHGRDLVEDIYPCSSMQEGIMFSQLRDPSAYILHAIFNVKDTRNNEPINIPRLRKAWQMVVNRHSILRTIFVDSSSKDGSFDQVVLRDLHADMVELDCSDSNILEQLNKVSLEETNRKHSMKHLHQVTVCKAPNGSAVMKLEMNHAIIDGASVGVLLRDFSLAYERQLSTQPGPSYRDYIAYMRSHANEEGVQFWTQYLRGIKPCHLPASGQGTKELKSVKMDFHRFAELRQLGQRESVTLANLILTAWAIVLREFTGTQDVCFGYLSAGRDAPVAGIQEAVGIFINMLCCRVQFSQGQSLADTFKGVQDDFFRSIPYQSCSLATVQNELGLDGQMLFNSALSIQNKMPSANPGTDALSFDIQQAYDPSEFPVTVNAMTTQGGEGILLRYWSNAISDSQANLLVSGIARVFVAFIENSSGTIPAAGNLVTLEPQQLGQMSAQGSLRRRSSVRSRSPRLSVSDPLIQQQIDQRVNEILSRVLKKEDLAKLQEPSRDAAAQYPANSTSNPDHQSGVPVSPVSRMSSIRRRFSVISRTSRRRMSMDFEKKLLMLWSSALNLPIDSIDRQDSFFSVGGDSVKAMKMASAARDEGLVMTVADVFRNPVFEDMLAVIYSTAIVHTAPMGPSAAVQEEYHPDSKKVGEIFDDTFPSGTVSRQSLHITNVPDMPIDSLPDDICPKVGLFKGGIADVLPVTDFQALSLTAQLFESRWMLNYFYLDGEGQLDLKRLRESCARVVDAFDILRTVFVCSGANFYQVILKKVRPSIAIYETQTDLDAFTASLQQRDRDQGLPQGEQFVQFVVAKRQGTNQHRLLIRMSHAQYDGMCVSKIFEALKQGYEGGTLAPAMPYSSYMRLLPSAISADHYEYWTNLLKGSRMTEVVSRDYPNRYQTMGASTNVSTTINIGQNSTIGNITVGTIVQAAWALALARLSADADVVFGLTTNGRNASIPGVQDVVGPCLNIIPVRVTFGNRWTGLDLIRYLQDQLVTTMPYESLGFREIIQRCTDWHCSTFFSTAVLHQNVDFEGHIDLDNNQYHVGAAGAVDNLADLTLVSKSLSANQISLTLGYSATGPITEIFASRVLHLVADTIVTLTTNPTAPLPSPTTLRSLPPQTVPDLPRIPDHEILTSQLKSQNISDILLHSAILSRTWQQVLPTMQSNQKTFQLDTSFYDLGGDVFALGQATWLLQQEGYQIRIEDLLDRPTFLGHMAVLAQDTMGQDLQEGTVNVQQEEAPTPAEKAEKKVRWKKAFGIMGKFSKRESISS